MADGRATDKIVFLGTGGGRVLISSQFKATGGIILVLDDVQIHIDPGPGAIIRAKEYKVNPKKTSLIIATHCHLDHVNDLEVMVEAMTDSATKKKGCVISNKAVLEGAGKSGPAIDPYHKGLVEKIITLNAGKTVSVEGLKITGTKVIHDESGGFGVVIKSGKVSVGYTSDTQYFEGLSRQFEGCDVLIVNVLRPGDEFWKGHLCSADAGKLVKEVNPRTAIITHYGMKMIMSGYMDEVRNIKKLSGVHTIASQDGMIIEIDELLTQKRL